MSYPPMKLEQNSPRSYQKEDLTIRDERKVFQNPTVRPKSDKPTDPHSVVKKKNERPTSSKKSLVSIGSKLSIKTQNDAHLLSRLKPTYVSIDKEKLYEDNMALKLTLNSLQTENLKIKTRILQLEKEVSRKNEIIEELSCNENKPGHKYVHLVNNLKQAIREGKIELGSKDQEINKLKKNIKSTKIVELEIQILSFEEECRRLSQNLEEALSKQASMPPQHHSSYDKKLNSDLLNSLKKENVQLKNNLSQAQEEIKKNQQERLAESDNKNPSGSQVTHLKLELQKLRTQIDCAYKESKEKETQFFSEISAEQKKNEEIKKRLNEEERKNRDFLKLIEDLKNKIQVLEKNKQSLVSSRRSPNDLIITKKIRKSLKQKKISLSHLFKTLDKDRTGFVDLDEFLKVFKLFGRDFKRNDLEYLTENFEGKPVVSLLKLQKKLEKFQDPSSSSEKKKSAEKKIISFNKVPVFSEASFIDPQEVIENEVLDYLKHISLSLQLNRIQKNQIYEIFFYKYDINSQLSRTDLGKIMKNPSVSIPSKVNTEKLCDFLIPSADQGKVRVYMKVSEVIKKLEKYLPDWQIFDSNEEEIFDSELTQTIKKHKTKIKQKCREFDTKESGTITLENFKTAIKEFKGLTKDRIFQYLTLLFYSHEYELNKVPYLHFIEAYGEQKNEESQKSESEKAEKVQLYLKKIATALKKRRKTVKQVFQTEKKLISPESFISGLEHLGLKAIEHDNLALILEALQYEKENEACIHLEEFENIMKELGVSLRKLTESSNSEEIKKLSKAESGTYEYSEDSRERQKVSDISPFASISNLHTKKNSGKSSKNKADKSSKPTLTVSKIEPIHKENHEDSINEILKQGDSSRSFDSQKKLLVLIKDNFLDSEKKSKSSSEESQVESPSNKKKSEFDQSFDSTFNRKELSQSIEGDYEEISKDIQPLARKKSDIDLVSESEEEKYSEDIEESYHSKTSEKIDEKKKVLKEPINEKYSESHSSSSSKKESFDFTDFAKEKHRKIETGHFSDNPSAGENKSAELEKESSSSLPIKPEIPKIPIPEIEGDPQNPPTFSNNSVPSFELKIEKSLSNPKNDPYEISEYSGCTEEPDIYALEVPLGSAHINERFSISDSFNGKTPSEESRDLEDSKNYKDKKADNFKESISEDYSNNNLKETPSDEYREEGKSSKESVRNDSEIFKKNNEESYLKEHRKNQSVAVQENSKISGDEKNFYNEIYDKDVKVNGKEDTKQYNIDYKQSEEDYDDDNFIAEDISDQSDEMF